MILSAQCTDAAVNKVTPGAFPSLSDAASAQPCVAVADIESLIRTLGLFRAKAKIAQTLRRSSWCKNSAAKCRRRWKS